MINLELVQCPDCNLSDSPHIKIHSQKRGYCKGAVQEEVAEEVKVKANPPKEQPPGLTTQKPTKTVTNITDENVNTYIKENHEIVTNCLRTGSYENTQSRCTLSTY